MDIEPLSEPLDDAAARRAADSLYYRRVLHELVDLGAELARHVVAEAAARAAAAIAGQPPAGAAPDLTLAFDRIARTIRRTVNLARRLEEPVRVRPDHSRAGVRRRIIRGVEDVIQREAEGAHEEAGLRAELLERMDGADVEDEIDERPADAIIADICRDLGLTAPLGTHPWARRTPEDIATLCARGAAPAGGTVEMADVVAPGPTAPPRARLDGDLALRRGWESADALYPADDG